MCYVFWLIHKVIIRHSHKNVRVMGNIRYRLKKYLCLMVHLCHLAIVKIVCGYVTKKGYRTNAYNISVG